MGRTLLKFKGDIPHFTSNATEATEESPQRERIYYSTVFCWFFFKHSSTRLSINAELCMFESNPKILMYHQTKAFNISQNINGKTCIPCSHVACWIVCGIRCKPIKMCLTHTTIDVQYTVRSRYIAAYCLLITNERHKSSNGCLLWDLVWLVLPSNIVYCVWYRVIWYHDISKAYSNRWQFASNCAFAIW